MYDLRFELSSYIYVCRVYLFLLCTFFCISIPTHIRLFLYGGPKYVRS
jgi:hypothetical protein